MSRRARDALAQVPLFSGLSPRHLKRLADLTEERRYMEGAAVVKQGEQGDTFYVILGGQAKVVTRGGKVVNRLLPGSFFGEISLLDGGPRTASVVAETPLVMLALSRREFLRVLQAEPAVTAKLLRHTAAMLRRMEHGVG